MPGYPATTVFPAPPPLRARGAELSDDGWTYISLTAWLSPSKPPILVHYKKNTTVLTVGERTSAHFSAQVYDI